MASAVPTGGDSGSEDGNDGSGGGDGSSGEGSGGSAVESKRSSMDGVLVAAEAGGSGMAKRSGSLNGE